MSEHADIGKMKALYESIVISKRPKTFLEFMQEQARQDTINEILKKLPIIEHNTDCLYGIVDEKCSCSDARVERNETLQEVKKLLEGMK